MTTEQEEDRIEFIKTEIKEEDDPYFYCSVELKDVGENDGDNYSSEKADPTDAENQCQDEKDLETSNVPSPCSSRVQIQLRSSSVSQKEVEPTVPQTSTESKNPPAKKPKRRKVYSKRSKVILKCSRCNYSTFWKSSLNFHIMSHDGIKRFKCTQCDYGTNQKSHLTAHLLKHGSTREFMCSQCDYKTDRKGNLTAHTLNHKGIKRYVCPQCGYGTNVKRDLLAHILNHEDIKCFRCSQCDYGTNRKSDLSAHEFIHSSKKRFNCTMCDFGTNTKRHLASHAKRKGH